MLCNIVTTGHFRFFPLLHFISKLAPHFKVNFRLALKTSKIRPVIQAPRLYEFRVKILQPGSFEAPRFESDFNLNSLIILYYE